MNLRVCVVKVRRCGVRGSETLLVEVFYENDFVALLVVNELVHELAGDQDAEATRAQTSFFADRCVTEQIVTWIGDRSMLERLVEAAPRMLGAVCDGLGWQYGALWEVDRARNVLRCSGMWQPASHSLDEFASITRQMRFTPGVGLPGRVWSSGQPAQTHDVIRDPNFPRAPVALKVGLHAAFAIPVVQGAAVIGVMEFFTDTILEPTPELLAMMSREACGLICLALDGAIPTRYTEGNQEYDIRVRLPRERFQNAEDLGSIALFAGRDRPVYLRDVATVQLKVGPSSIRRENQNRQYRINGDVNDAIASVGDVNREVRARLADLHIPDGYGLVFGGEEETIRENQKNLLIVTVLAVFLVWVVMAVQYESVTNPLVILVTVPLALVGVVLLLWITSTPLSAPVLLGVILLAGIVVNNAILLVEYVEQIFSTRFCKLGVPRGLTPEIRCRDEGVEAKCSVWAHGASE